MGPSISTGEALFSTTARHERDRQMAAWCGLIGPEAEAFLERVEHYDRRTRVLELLALEIDEVEVDDSLAGMLRRVDAVIADLVEQLRGEVVR